LGLAPEPEQKHGNYNFFGRAKCWKFARTLQEPASSAKRTENGQKDEYVQKSFAYAQEPHESGDGQAEAAVAAGADVGSIRSRESWESQKETE